MLYPILNDVLFLFQPLSSALDWDDRNTRISWRGDGEYFACSTIDPESKSRQIRVWSRECVLHSTGERVDGLGQAICWRYMNIHEYAFALYSVSLGGCCWFFHTVVRIIYCCVYIIPGPMVISLLQPNKSLTDMMSFSLSVTVYNMGNSPCGVALLKMVETCVSES